ncbi:MAG: ferredoxin reductase [Terrabacter sp.]
MSWQAAHLVSRRNETAEAVTLVFGVPRWPGHLPGQHVDVRLTADDGYSTQRSYSMAAPDHGAQVELTVQVVPAGEVSPFLARDLAVGDPVELRGPIGGWFVWHPQSTRPTLLLAGGSGVVPLMAMLRARHEAGNTVPMLLVYSVRTPTDAIYADELARRAARDEGLAVKLLHTRQAPTAGGRPVGRVTREELATWVRTLGVDSDVFVCGPTGFVDAAADALVDIGVPAGLVRTERFGPSGG